MPYATVLLPFRDAARTLGEALDSLLSEEGDFEVLAIDDGSRDGGAELVRGRDPRVVLVQADGTGIVGALNTGLARASAPFVVRMDADDVHVPGRIARSVAALESDRRLGCVGTRVRVLADAPVGEGLARYVAWQNTLLTPEEHETEIFVESPICHPTFALRTETLRALGGYRDGPFAEDYDVLVRLDAAGAKLAKLPDVGLHWRHAEGRLTFRDPRYSPESFRTYKARELARRLGSETRPVVLWGAGRDGRRMLRELHAAGLTIDRVVDVDPRKIGRTLGGKRIVAHTELPADGATYVLASVGSRGARAEIRAYLRSIGYREPTDFRMLA